MFPTYENNHERLLIYFFSIGPHVLYPITKFEIQFLYREKKKYH